MPDYSLGRAHGEIQIDYDGSGADRAASDLDKVATSSESADQSLTKTQKTLRDTGKEFEWSGNAADGYSARLRDVRQASNDVDHAERNLKATLLDSKATVDDIEGAYKRLEETQKRHSKAVAAERDAHIALSGGMSALSGAASLLASVMPKLSLSLSDAGDASADATGKLGGLTAVLGLLGPWGRAAAIGLGAVTGAADALGGAAKNIGTFELAFGKIAGLTLAVPSIAGLAGLGGAAGVQGIVEMAGAAKQLSGALGLLPAVMAGVEFSSQTLQVAFHGVDDALKDMMSDDPKKFLEDIKDMAPLAAQAMLQVAQFRDGFKGAGAAVQQTFFAQIINDIAPLIQTWLPAITTGMVKVSGAFGEAAHHLAGLLQQPALMSGFTSFIDNLVEGIKALEPAMVPLLNIFNQLITVGSSFFGQLGGQVSQFLSFFSNVITQAAASGKLQAWIQDAINGVDHLINTAYLLGDAFLTIMDVADKFGGGGLLAWIEQLAQAFDGWTKSSDGQKTLTEFFSTLRTATDAFTPMLKPLVEGLAALATAFVQLGIGIAPGWQTFFNTFAQTMQNLGPQIVGMGPALVTFLNGMSQSFSDLMATVGPQLPRIFQDLANAFVALLPQIPQLAAIFVNLVETVGPQLPGFFSAVMGAIQALLPYVPLLGNLMTNLVTIFGWLIEAGGGVINFFTTWLKKWGEFLRAIPDALSGIGDKISGFFGGLGDDAEKWGIALVKGLVTGMLDSAGLGSLDGAAKILVDQIAKWFQSSPAKVGPFSGSGYTLIRGQKMVTDMAAGMMSAQSSISDAAASTAAAASAGIGTGSRGASSGGAPSPGGSSTTGSALLPDNIAGADTSILTAYLRHQFSDVRGLKGLAKDLGAMLDVAKGGFDLVNQHVVQPVFQALGMLPGAKDQAWRKMTPEELASQQQADAQKADAKKGPDWQDVLGPGASGGGGGGGGPLGLSASSSKEDIQKAIIAAGRARGMNDGAIQTALAIAADESGFQPNISGGVQGSAGLVSGLYQQSPSAGWGSLDQVNDPNYSINKFYDAFAQQLAKNPDNPLLAGVLTQNPQLGSSAKGSDYWKAVSNHLGQANSIMAQYGTGSTWQQLMGSTVGSAGNAAVGTAGGVPLSTVLPDVHGAHTQIAQIAAIAEHFGLKLTSGKNDHSVDQGFHPLGEAGDFAIPGMNDNDPRKLAFAKYMADNYGPLLQELIYSDPNFSQLIGGGKNVTGSGYYSTKTLGDHTNHVHIALKDEMAAAFQQAIGGAPLGATSPLSVGTGLNSGLVLPSGQPLGALTDAAQQNLSVNDKLLQSYLQGNPALADQINAAKTPGASDQTVMDTLTGINKTITDLQTQDAVGNKNTIDALKSQQTQLAQQQGFTQTPNGLQQAQSIAGGIASGISGVFQSISSGLEALAATQDVADRLVYGVRNTEDINHLIDDFQKYITFAANVISTVGSIISAAGSFTGGSDFGGTSAAGSALSMIASVLQGVNAAIDFGQQVYEITMGYVGRFMSVLTGLGGGTNLMGNVGFLLNKNTGELISYSQDNPQNQNTSKVPSWMNSWYDYNGKGNPNPQVNQQLNVYAGPGQSPAEMMNETMWMVGNQGTTGALAPANF